MVSNWNGFVSALNDNSIQNITISGNVVATGDNGNTDNGRANSVDRTVAINSQGRNVVSKVEMIKQAWIYYQIA